jgi:hypothetical protein
MLSAITKLSSRGNFNMSKKNKKNNQKKNVRAAVSKKEETKVQHVKIVNRLTLKSGAIVTSFGEGELRGDFVKITTQPTNYVGDQAMKETVVQYDDVELVATPKKKGLRVQVI